MLFVFVLLQDIPVLRSTLDSRSKDVDMKEEILYRLNIEYNDKYALEAVKHALNLSNFVDQYVG